jgi:hypothetical protein
LESIVMKVPNSLGHDQRPEPVYRIRSVVITAVLALTATYAVIFVCTTAHADTSTSHRVYTVDVFRCGGGVQAARHDTLADAVRQYGAFTARQATSHSIAQVRMRRGQTGSPISYLVARRVKACAA